MGGSNSNVELQGALSQLGWSSIDLARHLNKALPPDRRVHRSTPYTWLQGVLPRQPIAEAIAGVLTEASGRLIQVEELFPQRSNDVARKYIPAVEIGKSRRWMPEETVDLLNAATGAAIGHFPVSGSELSALAGSWVSGDHPLIREARTSRGTIVTDQFVDYLERDLAQLRRLDDGCGSQLVIGALKLRIAQAIELFRHSGYTTAVGRRLMSVAGQMAQLAGWLSFDLGRHGFAQHMYFLALRAASASGDRLLGALILSCIAFQQSWRDRPHDAARLMETARRGLAGTPATPRVKALIAMREARAHATNNQPYEASAALDLAHRNMALGAHSDDPDWTYWMSPTILTSETGRCHLQLGDLTRAETHLTDGLAELGENASRDRVLYGLSLALAQSRAGSRSRDLAMACHQVQQVLPLLSSVESDRCRSLVTTILGELEPHRRSPVVGILLDQTASVLTAEIC